MLKKLRFFFSSHKLFFELLAVLIITIPAYISLLNPQYFSMHDDQHVARLYLLDQGIRQGYLYSRWVDTLGFNFGYPLFNFYPPLVYYVGEFFHILGFSLTSSIKLVFISGFILGAVGIYLLAKRHLGRVAGLLASILYTYFFYHAVLIYVRGALAEFFTLALLPFVFLALDKIREDLTIKSSLFFGVIFSLLILNHPLIAVPFLLYFLFTYIFFLIITKERIKLTFLLALGALTGLLLSAFFWAPSMLERKFTLVDSILTKELANYSIHFVCAGQLLNSPWGFGGSISGCFDGLTFQLGRLHIAFIVFSGTVALWYASLRKKVSVNFEFFTYFLFLLLFSLFMTVENSKPIWDSFSYLWYLQFPWRFFTFTALFISMIGAFGLYYFQKLLAAHGVSSKKMIASQLLLLFIAGGLIIAVYQKYFHPASYLTARDTNLTTFSEIADRVSRTSFEFAPKGVKTKKNELGATAFDINPGDISQKKVEVLRGKSKITVTENKFQKKRFEVEAEDQSVIRLNTFNFPGWTYYLDGKTEAISSNNPYRLITVNVPSGNHTIEFKFENTSVRTVASWVSGLTFLGVLTFFGLQFKKRKA